MDEGLTPAAVRRPGGLRARTAAAVTAAGLLGGALIGGYAIAHAATGSSTSTGTSTTAPAAPANGAPANGAPANGAPANGAPANGAPANGAPGGPGGPGGRPGGGSFDPTKGGHVGANGVVEKLLTGDTLAKVTAAAQAAVPGATIERAENDAEGSPYEAHMKKSDGSEVTVKVDSNFKVTSVLNGMG
jgi:hypothetical protein